MSGENDSKWFLDKLTPGRLTSPNDPATDPNQWEKRNFKEAQNYQRDPNKSSLLEISKMADALLVNDSLLRLLPVQVFVYGKSSTE